MPRALVSTGREEPAAVQEVAVADPGPGQVRVAVQAATVNGIDAFAAQLAAATGATVLGTARPDFAASLRGLGAAHTIDYTGDLAAAVNAAAPERVTAVAHAAGDPFDLGRLLRPGGRLASIVGATAEQVGRDDVTVIPVLAVDTVEKLHDLLDEVAAGALEVPIAQTFPLEDAAAAVSAFGSPKFGKLVITIT